MAFIFAWIFLYAINYTFHIYRAILSPSFDLLFLMFTFILSHSQKSFLHFLFFSFICFIHFLHIYILCFLSSSSYFFMICGHLLLTVFTYHHRNIFLFKYLLQDSPYNFWRHFHLEHFPFPLCSPFCPYLITWCPKFPVFVKYVLLKFSVPDFKIVIWMLQFLKIDFTHHKETWFCGNSENYWKLNATKAFHVNMKKIQVLKNSGKYLGVFGPYLTGPSDNRGITVFLPLSSVLLHVLVTIIWLTVLVINKERVAHKISTKMKKKTHIFV